MPPRDRPRFVEVHQASSQMNAELIRMRLEEEWIPCVMLGDDTIGIFGQTMHPRLMVPQDIAEERADDIRRCIASVEGAAEPTPRAPYLIRLPRGCLTMVPLVLALTLGIPSLIALALGWPPHRVPAVAGLVVSALLSWLGVAMLLRERKRRRMDEARREEDAQ